MEFFKVLSLKESYELLQKQKIKRKVEEVELAKASNRILAQEIIAREDWPLAARSSMDGYALRAEDTFGASETNPAYLHFKGEILIDKPADFSLSSGECASIVTGGILPSGADSVLMVEHSERLSAELVEVRKAVFPGENVLLAGEDFKQGEVVFKSGTPLDFRQIGALATLGYARVKVFSMPSIGILSTGDELVEVSKKPEPGQVRDVNTYTLKALLTKYGFFARTYNFVPDDKEKLKEAIQKALAEVDVLLLSGGSSVGTRDLTLEVLKDFPGSEILFHGLALSPGKPTLMVRWQDKFVLGLPGQVTSAQVVLMVLGLPFLRFVAGEEGAFANPWPYKTRARLTRNIASKQGRFDFVRVKFDPETNTVTPVLGKSGLIKTLLLAQGLVPIADNLEGLLSGQEVEVWLF
jgi:molybdopterin molybdotransferase